MLHYWVGTVCMSRASTGTLKDVKSSFSIFVYLIDVIEVQVYANSSGGAREGPGWDTSHPKIQCAHPKILSVRHEINFTKNAKTQLWHL